jgi:hypothetical protein
VTGKKGRLLVAEHRHHTSLVGLHPDGGVPLAHVPQDRSQDQLSHSASLTTAGPCGFRS